jgi:phosphoribosyl-ATP pyrophosphohydrolase
MDEVSTSRGTKLSKSVAKLMMLAVRSGDAISVLGGGIPYATAMYRQKLKEGMPEAEARAFAFHEFVKATNETQQTTQADYTNQMQLDPAYRTMGMYRTGQMSAAKKVFEAAETIIQARKIQQEEGVEARERIVPNKAIVQSVSNMIYFTVLAPILFQVIAGNMLGGDDEEENERIWYDLKMDTLGSILQGYGFFGYVADGALNYLRGDEWKVNVPVIRTLMALMEMPKNVAEISQKKWFELSPEERMYFLQKEGKERMKQEENWMDMMNDFNERSFLGKMNEAETNTMIKNIGGKNIADLVENLGEFFAGNKKLVDALMNYDEGYLDKAIKSGKKDYIFEYFHGKPYLPDTTKSTGKQMIYAPDDKIDIFNGEEGAEVEETIKY